MFKSFSRVQAPRCCSVFVSVLPGLQAAAAVVQRSLVVQVSVLSSDHSRLEVVGDQPASSSTHSTKVKFTHGWAMGIIIVLLKTFLYVMGGGIPQFDNIFHQNHNQSDAACMVAVF